MTSRTQLFEFHSQHGKLTEFSGFEMPLWYSGIVDEHMAVRNAAGLFDVSHMGRVLISGNAASDFLEFLLPTSCKRIRDGRAFYSNMCNEAGGIIDDVIVNRFSSTEFLMVVNAGNREKDLAWLQEISESYDVSLSDISHDTALIALQGPLSTSLLQKLTDSDLSELKRFSFLSSRVNGARCLISRTGYTGEDGFELTIYDTTNARNENAMNVWNTLLDLGKEKSVLPCGLGARDSLRLEAGMCLYGQDIDGTTTPVEASLEGIINLDGRKFIGSGVLEEQLKHGVVRKRIAFSMIDLGIPRHGYEVLFGGRHVGGVTSGTFSPLLKKGIGMAYVPATISSANEELVIKIRETEKGARIVRIPFYDTNRYGYRRKL